MPNWPRRWLRNLVLFIGKFAATVEAEEFSTGDVRILRSRFRGVSAIGERLKHSCNLVLSYRMVLIQASKRDQFDL